MLLPCVAPRTHKHTRSTCNAETERHTHTQLVGEAAEEQNKQSTHCWQLTSGASCLVPVQRVAPVLYEQLRREAAEGRGRRLAGWEVVGDEVRAELVDAAEIQWVHHSLAPFLHVERDAM